MFKRKNQVAFGTIAITDDGDIEVFRVQRANRQGIWTESLKLLRDVFLIVVVLVLVGVFVAQPVAVEGTSMVPQLHDGERLLVNKLIYYKIKGYSWGHIKRGDIVCFWYPNDPNKSFVKRVIGLPGETVEVRNGRVFIDGIQLDESYIDIEHNKQLPNHAPKKVDRFHYYVMGDNRDNSSDSRYWGLVPEKYIYGKAFFRYWKPANVGFLEHGTYNIQEKTDPDDDLAGGDE